MTTPSQISDREGSAARGRRAGLWTGRLARRLTFANVAAALALFFSLSGTAAAATYVISANSQVGPATIAGHQPPLGDHSNVIAGSINGTDIYPGSIGATQLGSPEGWHAVAPNPTPSGNGMDPCPTVAIFCGASRPYPNQNVNVGFWANAGGTYTPGGFYRDPQSRVHLRGLVSWASSLVTPEGTAIFYLPVGYRPAHELVFATLDNNSAGSYLARVDVDPSGAVHIYNDNEPTTTTSWGATFLSLDVISFRAGE